MYRPHNAVTERLRDVVCRAVQRVPGGRDYVLQMKYKPMPRYVDGVVAGVNPKDKHDAVGRMFPQPDVEVHVQRMRSCSTMSPARSTTGVAPTRAQT
jgi:3-(3-hydroxy-phenyl)propionate hydroxylase